MRTRFLAAFLITVIGAGGYMYYTAHALCNIPILYRIGDIDQRFDLSEEEAHAAITDAESLWEAETGLNLFTFDNEKGLPINFIFDERQNDTLTERKLRDELEEKQDLSESVKGKYEALKKKYNDLHDLYEARVSAYEARLKSHNDTVALWNDKGGAPPEVYNSLQQEQATLAKEQQELNTLAYELNKLVREINAVGERGNVLVNTYNNVVETYNREFDEEREFTQGDYVG